MSSDSSPLIWYAVFMKALWWFEEGLIAGMARPGFNCTHFFDYPYDEAVLMGWLGLFSSGKRPRQELINQMKTYCPKVAPYFGKSEEDNRQLMELYQTKEGLLDGLKKISQRAKHLKRFDVTEADIHFEYSAERLDEEIKSLKKLGIQSIVTLTEEHHNRAELAEHFQVHHFSIYDLDAPSVEQVNQLAEIIRKSKIDESPMAVHCLAGIGRTSTMLIAAHLVLGGKFENIMEIIKRQNPSYTLSGSQKKIIDTIQNEIN